MVSELKKVELRLNTFSNYRVKIVEQGGQTLDSLLIKKNPLGDGLCSDDNCNVC